MLCAFILLFVAVIAKTQTTDNSNNDYYAMLRTDKPLCFDLNGVNSCFLDANNGEFDLRINNQVTEKIQYELISRVKNKKIIVANEFQEFQLIFSKGKLVEVKQVVYSNDKLGIKPVEKVYPQTESKKVDFEDDVRKTDI